LTDALTVAGSTPAGVDFGTIDTDRDLGAALMTKLWDKSFTEKRDQRAEPGANAQRKGQISRELKAELQKVLPSEKGQP
jgi:hypothetical protein